MLDLISIKNLFLVVCTGLLLCGCLTQGDQIGDNKIQDAEIQNKQMKKIKMPKLSKKSDQFDIEAYIKHQENDTSITMEEKRVKSDDGTGYISVPISPRDVALLTSEEKNNLTPDQKSSYMFAASAYYTKIENEKYGLERSRCFDGLYFKERKTSSDSFISVVKEYRGDGTIRSKYAQYHFSGPMGIGYEYDKNGKFIKEVNHEEGYAFTTLDVLHYLRKRGVELPIGFQSSYYTYPDLLKYEIKRGKIWDIRYRCIIGGDLHKYSEILDGQTGEVIERRGGVPDLEELYKDGIDHITF